MPRLQVVRLKVPFMRCLEALGAEESVEDYKSGVTGEKTVATKHLRLATFPDLLIVQVKKFRMAPDWTTMKLDVELEFPNEILDLSFLRGKGLQEGEELLPEGKERHQ